MLSLLSVMMQPVLLEAHPHEILQHYRRETKDGKRCEDWSSHMEDGAVPPSSNFCASDFTPEDVAVFAPDPWEWKEGQPGCIAERDWSEVQLTVLACDYAPVWESMDLYCPGMYSGEFGTEMPEVTDLGGCAEACADNDECVSFIWSEDVEPDIQCQLSYVCDDSEAESTDGTSFEGWFPFEGHDDPLEELPLMEVRGGCDNVVFSEGGTCIETTGEEYANEDYCIIELNHVSRIVVEKFDVEDDVECSYDYLQMPNGIKFCGDVSKSPDQAIVPAGVISWETDFSVGGAGFKICAEELDSHHDEEAEPIDESEDAEDAILRRMNAIAFRPFELTKPVNA